MDLLLKEIGQIAVFLICAQTLLHFRAKDSYEKYIQLLISMMLLLLLTEPVLNLFHSGEGRSLWNGMDAYGQVMEEVMGKGLVEEEDIEQILQRITREKVEEGVEYVQELEESMTQENAEPNEPGNTQIVIENIEIGGSHGEF